MHGAHEQLLADTLADVAFLLKYRPWGSKVLAVGDWNVDQLPMLALDPLHLGIQMRFWMQPHAISCLMIGIGFSSLKKELAILKVHRVVHTDGRTNPKA